MDYRIPQLRDSVRVQDQAHVTTTPLAHNLLVEQERGAWWQLAPRPGGTSGLVWGHYGAKIDGVAVEDGDVTLTNNALNYVEWDAANGVTANTTGYTAGRIPMQRVQATDGTLTLVGDDRGWLHASGDSARAFSGDFALDAEHSDADTFAVTGGIAFGQVLGLQTAAWPGDGQYLWELRIDDAHNVTLAANAYDGGGPWPTDGAAPLWLATRSGGTVTIDADLRRGATPMPGGGATGITDITSPDGSVEVSIVDGVASLSVPSPSGDSLLTTQTNDNTPVTISMPIPNGKRVSIRYTLTGMDIYGTSPVGMAVVQGTLAVYRGDPKYGFAHVEASATFPTGWSVTPAYNSSTHYATLTVQGAIGTNVQWELFYVVNSNG